MKIENIKIGDRLWYGDGILVVCNNTIRDLDIYISNGLRQIEERDVSPLEWNDLMLLKMASFLEEQVLLLKNTLKNEELNDFDEFKESCKPLIKYLAENHHPHTICIVNSTQVEILEGKKIYNTEEFIVD